MATREQQLQNIGAGLQQAQQTARDVQAGIDRLRAQQTQTTEPVSLQAPIAVEQLAPSIPDIPRMPAQTPTVDESPVVLDATQRQLERLGQTQSRDQQLLDLQEQSIFDAAGLQQFMLGESEELATQRKKRGIEEKESRLLGLRNEAIRLSADINRGDAELAAGLAAIEDQAIPMEFITGQQVSIERRAQTARALKRADLGMLNAEMLAEQGNIALAEQQAQRAVDEKYAPYRERLEYQNEWLKTLAPVFSAAESREAAKVKAANDAKLQALEDQKDFEKERNDLAIKAQGFEAPGDVVSNILGAETMVDAINAATGHLSKKEDPLDRLLKLATLEERQTSIRKMNKEIAGFGTKLDLNNYIKGSPEWYAAKFMNTSGAKQQLASSQQEDLSKIGLVTEQLDSLSDQILGATDEDSLSGRDKRKGTGPIEGRARYVYSLFGGDADAKAIQAAMQGMIPNVARGVFGEVGVLTNADIENYKQTIPNLTNTADQNKAVTAVLLTTLKNSLKTRLDAAANSNVDVSGWADTYVDLEAQINTIEDDIGVTGTKVESIYTTADPNTQGFIEEMFSAGATNREVLDELNKL